MPVGQQLLQVLVPLFSPAMGYSLLKFCLGKYKYVLYSRMNTSPNCMILVSFRADKTGYTIMHIQACLH